MVIIISIKSAEDIGKKMSLYNLASLLLLAVLSPSLLNMFYLAKALWA